MFLGQFSNFKAELCIKCIAHGWVAGVGVGVGVLVVGASVWLGVFGLGLG